MDMNSFMPIPNMFQTPHLSIDNSLNNCYQFTMKIGHIMILNDTHSVNNLQKLFEKQQSTRKISSSSELYEFGTLYVQM